MSLLPVSEALERTQRDCRVLETEQVALPDAMRRILAADLPARFTQPAFDASSMDGYAVRAADVADAPAKLKVIGEAPAGHAFEGKVEAGEAVRIFTGAPVPEGADTVIMQEVTVREGDRVMIGQSPPKPRHFVRPRGLDFCEGDILLHQGRRLGPREIGLAAAMNHAELPVRRKPKVAILATGDELVFPGQTPRPDQIIASNSFALAALVTAFGGDPVDLGLARDNRASLIEMGSRALEADIIVTSGGASVGDHDLVIDVFEELGLKVDFWKVAQRPGKPMIFGHLGKSLFLGLPGNPVSSLVCARVYLKPMIDAMLGLPGDADHPEEALIGAPLPANDERQDFLRAALSKDENGQLTATAFGKQDSSMMNILARADCLLIRPPQAPASKPGERARILRFHF